MILPDFVLPDNINLILEYSGIDHPKYCIDTEHFQKYPHSIQYNYNSRGYRDDEWPESRLDQAVWCLGDSFTAGIGSPVQHTWTYLLSQQLSCRTINVSMDGASNNWIAKKAISMIGQIRPKIVVLHWSYIERREGFPGRQDQRSWMKFYNNIKDPSWPDCPMLEDAGSLPESIFKEITDVFKFPLDMYLNDHNLRVHCSKVDIEQDITNTWQCINSVMQAANQSNVTVVNSFIPEFISHGAAMPKFWTAPEATKIQHVPEFERLDLARDGHHYDILTAQYFVNQLVDKLSCNQIV